MNERPVTLISNAVLGMIQPASKTGALLRVQSHTSLLIASWQNIQMSSHNSTWHSVSKKLAGILLTSHFWNFTYKCQPLKGPSEHRVQRSCSPPDCGVTTSYTAFMMKSISRTTTHRCTSLQQDSAPLGCRSWGQAGSKSGSVKSAINCHLKPRTVRPTAPLIKHYKQTLYNNCIQSAMADWTFSLGIYPSCHGPLPVVKTWANVRR